jgi:protein-L-isoaspartate O-methyltransferase
MGAVRQDEESIPLRTRLAAALAGRGLLTDPAWRTALREVPRELFVPDTAWAVPDDPALAGFRIDRQRDPAGWMSAVYSDTSIVTQADDGAADPAAGSGLFSSSVSAPGVVIPFLELLSPRPGDRVLEIGTGSGWTACLLAWKTGGAGHVVSVEVDPEVSARAAASITRTPLRPRLITGDGLAGAPDDAPFDRVHITAGVAVPPMAWIRQARPGGTIVMPWQPGGPVGHKLRLTVISHAKAAGTFHGPASYMMIRSQRPNTRWNPHHASQAQASATRLDPCAVAAAGPGASLFIGARAPGTGWMLTAPDDHGRQSLLAWEHGSADGAWAACDYRPAAASFEVTQYGKRRLWDEIESAFLGWCALGQPAQDRFGLTVEDGQTSLWLDHPGNILVPPGPRRRSAT